MHLALGPQRRTDPLSQQLSLLSESLWVWFEKGVSIVMIASFREHMGTLAGDEA
jgi:hypothetical protein